MICKKSNFISVFESLNSSLNDLQCSFIYVTEKKLVIYKIIIKLLFI